MSKRQSTSLLTFRGREVKVMAIREDKSHLLLAVAELIKRMSQSEQAALLSHFTWQELKEWEELKRETESQAMLWPEPEVYVKIGAEEMIFEAPPEKVIPFLQQLVQDTAVEQITVRFHEDGKRREWQGLANELPEMLWNHSGIISDDAVVIEYGQNILYSNGGGCMMLDTTADAEVKRRIAQHFLDLCGHPHRVGSDRFIALVRDGRLKVLEE